MHLRFAKRSLLGVALAGMMILGGSERALADDPAVLREVFGGVAGIIRSTQSEQFSYNNQAGLMGYNGFGGGGFGAFGGQQINYSRGWNQGGGGSYYQPQQMVQYAPQPNYYQPQQMVQYAPQPQPYYQPQQQMIQYAPQPNYYQPQQQMIQYVPQPAYYGGS